MKFILHRLHGVLQRAAARGPAGCREEGQRNRVWPTCFAHVRRARPMRTDSLHRQSAHSPPLAPWNALPSARLHFAITLARDARGVTHAAVRGAFALAVAILCFSRAGSIGPRAEVARSPKTHGVRGAHIWTGGAKGAPPYQSGGGRLAWASGSAVGSTTVSGEEAAEAGFSCASS